MVIVMNILITGFEPFDKEIINSSYEAVKLLPNRIENIDITKLEVPVTYQNAAIVVLEELKNNKYDAVILVGQAGGRKDITLEKVAINYIYAKISDNQGVSLNHQNIVDCGDDAYFTTLPIIRMSRVLNENNIPASISFTAGAFVCNNLMYKILNYAKGSNLKVGFIHVPYCREQLINKENIPFMELEDIKKGLEICVKECLMEEDTI